MEMVKPRREAGKAGKGERPSSPGEIWMDPKGSRGAAGKQREPLVLLSCWEGGAVGPGWCWDKLGERVVKLLG